MAEGTAAYENALGRYEHEEVLRRARHSQLIAEHQARCAAEERRVALQHEAVDAFRKQYEADHPIAVAKYFKTVLELDKLPDGIPRSVECRYSAEDGELFVVRNLPPHDIIPTPLSYRYIKTRDEIQVVPRSVEQSDQLYDMLIAQLIIRSLYIVFASDSRGQIRSAHLDPISAENTAFPNGSENVLSGWTWCTPTGLTASLKEVGFDAIATIKALRRRQDYKAHLAKLLLKRHGLPLHWEIVGQMAMESYPTIFESRRAILLILQGFPELFEPQGNGVFGLKDRGAAWLRPI
jgi:hypothetical protein